MKNVIQHGVDREDFDNAGGDAIVSGQLIALGTLKNIVACSTGDIPAEGKGTIAKNVIVKVPKVAGTALARGDSFKVGTAGNTVEAHSAGDTAQVLNAYVHKTAADVATTVEIVIRP